MTSIVPTLQSYPLGRSPGSGHVACIMSKKETTAEKIAEGHPAPETAADNSHEQDKMSVAEVARLLTGRSARLVGVCLEEHWQSTLLNTPGIPRRRGSHEDRVGLHLRPPTGW